MNSLIVPREAFETSAFFYIYEEIKVYPLTFTRDIQTWFLQHLRILRVHCNLDFLRASDSGKCTGLWLAADIFISLYCNWYNREGKMVNKTACLTKVSIPYIISVIVQYMKNIKSMYIEAKLICYFLK